jgi:hypothetical protein
MKYESDMAKIYEFYFLWTEPYFLVKILRGPFFYAANKRKNSYCT